jgi:hypothetical protein
MMPDDPNFDLIFALQNKHVSHIAESVGYLTLSWNELQSNLLRLFIAVMAPAKSEVVVAVWHSQLSDKGQRDMLEAACRERQKNEPAFPFTEVLWLLDQAGKVSGYRNAAIHSTWQRGVEGSKPKPDTIYGNPKGEKFAVNSPKELLTEITAYTAQLHEYCNEVVAGVMGWLDGKPLRDKPQQPTFLAGQNPQGKSHLKKNLKSQSLPQSSHKSR